MTDLTKRTKAQLIEIIEQQEEDKYSVLKEETGLPYNTDEEWVEFIQSKVGEVCPECDKLKEDIARYRKSASRVY
tara:strand:- start:4 stop:228 length:225 start_codon:yes stop_codon:yes gene_type:complete